MNNQDLTKFITPKKCAPIRIERTKRFMRKPSENSERSSSKKSLDMSMKQMYIKTPTSSKNKGRGREDDFFKSLANSIMTVNTNSQLEYTVPKNRNIDSAKHFTQSYGEGEVTETTQPTSPNLKSVQSRMKALQAELDLKNHEASILSGQCQRMKTAVADQKQKRRKLESDKKQISRELKEALKSSDALKMELKKLQKEKQSLTKQINFLERINYDEKTRSLQSYRQKILQEELKNLRESLKKSQSQRYQQLQSHLRKLQQQKYNIQSHYKAMKVANQCLIKQINDNTKDLHEYVINSEEYIKLRQKYIRFLEEFKLMRNQYWNLKADQSKRSDDDYETSSIFSITASEVEKDLSILKNNLDLQI